MDTKFGKAGNGSRLAGEAGFGRPASRARRAASGGIRSPETAYRTLMDCAADILCGAIDASEANAVKSVIVGAVVVAKHADMMSDMEMRCEAEAGGGPDAAESKAAEIAELEARLAELKGVRPLPQKG